MIREQYQKIVKLLKKSNEKAYRDFGTYYKKADMTDNLKRGSIVYIRAVVDEIRENNIICKNKNGYFYNMTAGDIYVRPETSWIYKNGKYYCAECDSAEKKPYEYCKICGSKMNEVEEL